MNLACCQLIHWRDEQGDSAAHRDEPGGRVSPAPTVALRDCPRRAPPSAQLFA